MNWLCSWSFPFKVQSSIILFHTQRRVTSSLKLNLFDPDGHRRILIYRKQHTVPFINVAHLRVIFIFSLIIKLCCFSLFSVFPHLYFPQIQHPVLSQKFKMAPTVICFLQQGMLFYFFPHFILVARQKLNLYTVHVC